MTLILRVACARETALRPFTFFYFFNLFIEFSKKKIFFFPRHLVSFSTFPLTFPFFETKAPKPSSHLRVPSPAPFWCLTFVSSHLLSKKTLPSLVAEIGITAKSELFVSSKSVFRLLPPLERCRKAEGYSLSRKSMSFEEAAAYVRSLPKDGPVQLSNEKKLEFYSLFKQATEGDVKGSQPWAVQVEARMKWDAWNSRKGMKPEDAKALYVKLLTETVSAQGVDWTKK